MALGRPRGAPAPKAFALPFVAAVCGFGAYFLFFRQTTAKATAAAVAGANPPEVHEPVPDWCATGFEAIPGGCLSVSPKGAGDQPLILYLHGRFARTAPADEADREARLAARAAARGFAVLAVRAALGTCVDSELADWYCWPSNERNADRAGAFVQEWTEPLARAIERTGHRRPFLLGFSSGGYFAGLLASRGLLDTEAVVVAHGGPVEPARPGARKPPMLLLSADDDVAQQDMIRYGAELTREAWPHDSYARSGGHALTDEDIDAALTFFSRAHEPLPLVPALPLHRPILHPVEPEEAAPPAPARDAGDDDSDARLNDEPERTDEPR